MKPYSQAGFVYRFTSLGQILDYSHQRGATACCVEFYLFVFIHDLDTGMDTAAPCQKGLAMRANVPVNTRYMQGKTL